MEFRQSSRMIRGLVVPDIVGARQQAKRDAIVNSLFPMFREQNSRGFPGYWRIPFERVR